VRKILAVKHELGLVKNRFAPLDGIDSVVSSKATLDLADEIARKAVTLVRDEQKIIPIKNIADKKVFLLAVSNGEDRNFVSASLAASLRQGGVKLEVATLDARSSPEEARAAMAKAVKADIVIAGLYGRVRSGSKNSTGLPDNGVKILRELLDSNKPVIGISFGNPYILNSFPTMKTYLTAYGDMTMLQRATGNAILGKQDITGRLPITLPGLAPRGTGVQIRATN
jgi:beta-N-acetylhexosaminidase